jgi:LPXTG-motif cell wall-anchored protein
MQQMMLPPEQGFDWFNWLMGIIGALITAGIIWWFKSRRKK